MNQALLNISQLLINTVVGIYLFIMLLRFLFQYLRVDFYNPVSQFVVKATDPLLKPLSHIIPRYKRFNISLLLLMIVISSLKTLSLMLLLGSVNLGIALLHGTYYMINMALDFYFWGILIVIIASWLLAAGILNPRAIYNPVYTALQQVIEPFLALFRRFIPPIAGLDFSPVIAILVLHICNYLAYGIFSSIAFGSFSP